MDPKDRRACLSINTKKTVLKGLTMANLQGYTSGAVGNMLNHYTRHYGDPEQAKYTYNNQKIDVNRTHLNYALFEQNDPKGFIRQRVATADTQPTKTTNVISDWIVTLPKNEELAGREREFFEQSYKFLAAKVGQENIVGTWVHMDEASPHMHFCFVPLCEQTVMTNDKSQPLRWSKRDEAKNPAHKAGEVKRDSKGTVRYKRVMATDDAGNPIVKKTVSQSKVFDRKAMQDFHPMLERHLNKHFGFTVGIQLEDAGDKLLSKLSHSEYIAAKTKLIKTRAEVERIEDKREEIRELTAQELDRLERLRQAGNATQERVEVLETVVSACRAADNAPVSRRSAFFNRIAAVCNGFLGWLGVAVGKVRDAARERLTIAVRHGGNANSGLGGRWSASQGAPTVPRTTAQQQMELSR